MPSSVAVLLTSAVVKIASDKIGSAIAEQASLLWNFGSDLEDMKETLEVMAAALKDAERRSVRDESVRLWMKKLKHAAMDIDHMMDEYQGADAQATAKIPGMLSCFPITSKKFVLANKMKDMRERLQNIRHKFDSFDFARSTSASIEEQHSDQRETTSYVDEAQIIGRDEEKRAIIQLLSASENKEKTVIVPIYGLGGTGKSSLAALVYNDSQLKKYDHRVWVYVPEVFDLKNIERRIISQITGGQQNTDTALQLVERHLDDLLHEKTVLIVLDDMWEERVSLLDKLKSMLVCKSSRRIDVIVTTRKEEVANKMCTGKPYKLHPLKDDICWDIIKGISKFEDKANKDQLEPIGREIAQKCGGVPLAARVIGYTLKSKDRDGWSKVNNSDIWTESSGDEESSDQKEVLASLKLSYENMEPRLRLCFSYCAIFPKGYNIIEDDLIHQWIALDFIEPSKGKDYMKQLLGMSFLQYSKTPLNPGKNVVRYTMHDLVHFLARSVIEDELFSDAATEGNISDQKYCRYALLTKCDRQTKLPKRVRALHFLASSTLDLRSGAISFPKCLRILDFSECSGIQLPASIGQLRQLRCLTAPRTENETIPECITELSKLQYLYLNGSSQICALPESIGKLGCLIYLDLSGCSSIPKLPESLGDLKSLMHLDMSYCYGITRLPDSLGGLTNLQHLNLSDCFGVEALPESVCGLRKLQYLNLSSCHLRRLPEAIGSLIDLQYLDMSSCYNLLELPESFQHLQKLENLYLSSTKCTKGLSRALRGLISLQHLNMDNMNMDSEMNGSFHHGDLSDALGRLTTLKYLNLQRSIDVLFSQTSEERDIYIDFIGALTNLEHLDLSSNNKLVYLPESVGNLKRLHTLNLKFCRELKSLPDSIGGLENLQTLDLSFCEELKSLPVSIGGIKLKSLPMRGCSGELIDQASSLFPYPLTLPLFKVSGSACRNLHQLRGVDTDVLNIVSLENVRSLDEACRINLRDKQNLSYLSLSWESGAGRVLEDKDLLEKIVLPRGLKQLHVKGYSSISFPRWLSISSDLRNLVYIGLSDMPACSNLPPLGQLPNLEKICLRSLPSITKIDKDFCGGEGAFRQLSSFTIWEMEGLEEWNTTYSTEHGVEQFMFPKLDRLHVHDCPRLSLKPRLPIFRECTIRKSDQVLSSLEKLSNPSHVSSSTPNTMLKLKVERCGCKSLRLLFPILQELRIDSCPNLTSLPESMRHLASLQTLELESCESITALPESLGELSSLRSLTIKFCHNLMSLPESLRHIVSLESLELAFCDSISALPERLGDLSSLKSLSIKCCNNLISLPESLCYLVSLRSLELTCCPRISALPKRLGDISSLKSLIISSCDSIKSLPPSIKKLIKLQKLRIYGNEELMQWCESKENRKWLDHINDLKIRGATANQLA
ncbi:hypothetical protein ACP70R_002906 [Stipagrostis hirtigluma subsp. patula]